MTTQHKENAKGGRLMSLDAFRGLAIFGMITESFGRELISIPIIGIFFSQFAHSNWHGCEFIDLVFPAFMFIVGVAMPFSFAKRISMGHSYSKILFHVIKRTVILFLLGSLIMSVKDNSPSLFELSSAIQPIAVAYLVAFFLLGRSIKIRAAISGIIIIIYLLILEFISAPGIPAGTFEKDHNIVWYIDILLLGRAEPHGWGTLLLFFPQITHTLLGTIVGDLMLSDRSSYAKMKILGIASATFLIIGIIMDQFIPTVMKMWTPSYVVITTGFSFLFMLVFYWLIDVMGYKRWSFFFVIFGMNAIALYMVHRILESKISSIINIFVNDVVIAFGQAGPTFLFSLLILAEWLIFYWMYERKIFIKV